MGNVGNTFNVIKIIYLEVLLPRMTKQKNVPMELARTVRDYGVSQTKMGEVFGVSQSTISRRMNENNK